MYRTVERVAAALRCGTRAAEEKAILALRHAAMPLLRISLGTLFLWFGALKAVGLSPVTDIVTGTLPWIQPDLLMPALGAAEILFGAALITARALRLALPLLTLHLCGTFLTFLMLPELMVTAHNPLLLTAPGEFVMKNLVLIAAALALIGYSARPGEKAAPEAPGSHASDGAPAPETLRADGRVGTLTRPNAGLSSNSGSGGHYWARQ